MGSFELYRQTLMGDCLVEVLEHMMDSQKISQDLAEAIVRQFDNSMLEALRNHVTAKATIKANLKTYRYFDNVWQFNLENVNFRLTGSTPGGGFEVNCARAKVVCVDCKLLDEANPAPGEGGAGGAGGAAAAAGDGAAGGDGGEGLQNDGAGQP